MLIHLSYLEAGMKPFFNKNDEMMQAVAQANKILIFFKGTAGLQTNGPLHLK